MTQHLMLIAVVDFILMANKAKTYRAASFPWLNWHQLDVASIVKMSFLRH